MKRDLWEKEWNDLTRKQEKYVQKHSTEKESVLEKLQRFVPNGLQSKLDAAFVKAAAAEQLTGLKGHRLVGGIRASIYNAMPLAGVEKLIAFMDDFASKNA